MYAAHIALAAAGIYLTGIVVFLTAIHLGLAADPRRSPRCRPWRALAEEILWAALVQITIPVGFFFWPWWWRRPARRAGESAPIQDPTLLLHGWGQNRADWWAMAMRLRARGRGSLYALNYWFFGPIERSAARLDRELDRILRETGAKRVHVVAHSLGGLVTRTLVEGRGGAEKVRTLVAIGSPLAGTHRAGRLWGPSSRQMSPGSTFLRRLGPPTPPAGVRYHAVWSHSDGMVLPPQSASLLGAGEELQMEDAGHLTPLLRAETADAVARWLDASEAATRPMTR